MSRLFKVILASIVFCMVFQSCDDSFSPSGPEVPRMIVYSVLTTQSDRQYVRVYRNYFPADNEPKKNVADHPVTDAMVTIFDGITTYTFHDTLVARDDTSRYKEPIFAYVATGFRAKPGATYTLNVNSPTYGTVTATTKAPTPSTFSIDYFYYFENPYAFFGVLPQVSFSLSNFTSAYMIKLFIEYDADMNTGREIFRREVPERLIVVSCFFEIYDFIYPKITRRTNTANANLEFRGTQHFNRFAYRRSVELVNERNLNPAFRRVIFYNIQFDENWYRYYSTARTFQDRFTARLDEPDFTTLIGGVGLFGAMTIDSASHQLPQVILPPSASVPSACR